MKKAFRTNSGSIWVKIRKNNNLTDVLYGLTDGNNNHRHTVFRGASAIYQRDISGATLVVSGTALILNDNFLTSL